MNIFISFVTCALIISSYSLIDDIVDIHPDIVVPWIGSSKKMPGF